MRRYLGFIVITVLTLVMCWIGQGCKKEEDMEQVHQEYKLAGKLKIPSVEAAENNQYIYCYNHELCQDKGLIDGDSLSRYYLCMQAVYRANLDAYLLEILDLGALDDELKNSGLGFVSKKPADKNLYERESTMGLEFIYLRNNLYIEYLEKDQLKLLETQLKEGTAAVTDELKRMAGETCKEVIRVRNPRNREDQGSFLYSEAQGRKPRIPNEALVLQISNAERYDASGNFLPTDNMKEKCEYLDKKKKKKEREYSGIIGTKVYILLE